MHFGPSRFPMAVRLIARRIEGMPRTRMQGKPPALVPNRYKYAFLITVTRILQSGTRVLLAVCELFLFAHALPIKTQLRPQLEVGLYSPGFRVRLRIFH